MEIKNQDIIISENNTVNVISNNSTDTETSPEVVVQAKVNKWTIVGDDIYIANRTEELPIWFSSLIDAYMSSSSVLVNDLNDLKSTFDNFNEGYTQEIGHLQDGLDEISYNITNNYVTNGVYTAGIQNLELSKVDENQASAIASNVIGAWGIDPTGGGAWFSSKISTFADTQSSHAASISSLSASYNGLSVSIDDVSQVVSDVSGWAANASKLITGTGGGITGWSFADGSNITSNFNIYADNFKISNSTQNYTPFSIVGTDILFNGKVSFTNVEDSENILLTGDAANDVNTNTTTINGGKITTNTIDANKLLVNSIWTNGSVVSSDFTTIGGAGFRLKAGAAGTNADPTIYGAYIRGATLDSSTMKVKDLVVVTDAGYETKGGISTTTTASGFGIYPYNSTTGDTYRLGSLSDSVVLFSGKSSVVISALDTRVFLGPVITDTTYSNSAGVISIRLLAGTNILGEYMPSYPYPDTCTINGITFQTWQSYPRVIIAINGSCKPTNITGTGQIKAQWRCTNGDGSVVYDNWTDMNTSAFLAVINI